MAKHQSISELQGFLQVLEHARLEYVELVMERGIKGDEVLNKLAAYGQAIESMKGTIKFAESI